MLIFCVILIGILIRNSHTYTYGFKNNTKRTLIGHLDLNECVGMSFSIESGIAKKILLPGLITFAIHAQVIPGVKEYERKPKYGWEEMS